MRCADPDLCYLNNNDYADSDAESDSEPNADSDASDAESDAESRAFLLQFCRRITVLIRYQTITESHYIDSTVG